MDYGYNMIHMYMIIIYKWPWAHFFHTVKRSYLFLFKIDTQLKVKTVLFQTTPFCVSTV